MREKISIALSFCLIGALILSGCGCKNKTSNYKVSLEIWGLFDDSGTFYKAIDEYKKRNPLVGEITYKKLTIDSYENDLRDSLATGKGPDIFLIHNTWLSKHQDKMAPAPQAVVNLKQVQDSFPDVVVQDFTKNSNVYALPLSVDSLALYVNKDILNQAGITRPPQSWIEFDEVVRKVTKVDSFGNIRISGAAMGMSSDANPGDGKINRATDILTLLMMQSGAEMLNQQNNMATFANYVETQAGQPKSPGQMALEYYEKFANASSAEYCWNSRMHNSIDSFIEGQVAMMLNYSWLISKIELKAPKLNFGVYLVPQNIDQQGKGLKINFANYWGFAVSKNRLTDNQTAGSTGQNAATNDQRIFEAWRLVRYLAMNPSYSQDLPRSPVSGESAKFDSAADYAAKQKKPAARRDLIEVQMEDPLLAPFVQGNLIAHTWAQPDNLAVERIFDDMIDDVVLKNISSRDAIEKAQNAVNLLIKK